MPGGQGCSLSQHRAAALGLLWRRPSQPACRGSGCWGHGRPRDTPGPGPSPPQLSPQMGLSRAVKGWVGAGAPVRLGVGVGGLDMCQVHASPSDAACGLCCGPPAPSRPEEGLVPLLCSQSCIEQAHQIKTFRARSPTWFPVQYSPEGGLQVVIHPFH